jgi:hypothetical protein
VRTFDEHEVQPNPDPPTPDAELIPRMQLMRAAKTMYDALLAEERAAALEAEAQLARERAAQLRKKALAEATEGRS